MKKELLLILFLCVVSGRLFAIGDDSSYHRYNPTWTKYYRFGQRNSLSIIDTTLNQFEIYNPALRNYWQREIGNMGYPAFDLSPQVEKGSGLDIGIHAYDPYLFTADNNLFYQTQKPYTFLSYVLGSELEQMFSGAHTQNVTSQYNFGVNFVRLGSQGGFLHQRTDYFNINVFQSYHSKNDRYHADLSTFMNRAKVHLNGGVAVPQDSVYHSSRYISRNIVPVNLDTAVYKLNKYHLAFLHSYSWGNFYTHKINDTTSKKKFVPHYFLQHRLQLSYVRHIYEDDSMDSRYFPSPLKNLYQTLDTIAYYHFSNRVDFTTADTKYGNDSATTYRNVVYDLFIKHDLYSFKHGIYGNVQNGILGGSIGSGLLPTYFRPGKGLIPKYSSSIRWNINADYSLLDYNKDDYSGDGFLRYNFIGLALQVNATVKRYMPSLVQQSYFGNYYQWNNSFSAQKFMQYGAAFSAHGDDITISYNKLLFTDPVYYGYGVTPGQYKGTVSGDLLSVKFKIKMVKHFHFDNQLVFQRYNNDIFHYPSFYSSHSVYYGGYLFKKALQVNMGIDANYNATYYASSFEPSTSQFYLQNSLKTGNYLWMDAFVGMKIKTVRVAVKVDNVLQGIVGDALQPAPGYLTPDRSYKVYIYWMFWN